MRVINGIIIAFSMFTKLPMPQVSWKKENMNYIFCGFPLIGLVIGGLLYGWICLGGLLQIKGLLFAVGCFVLPLWVTGGIHMDGFCDVIDGVASYGDREKKLEIMADPHVGAFAVLGLVIYSLLTLAIFSELEFTRRATICVGMSFFVSRIFCGLGMVTLPSGKTSGLAYEFSTGARKKVVAGCLVGMLLLASGLLVWVSPLYGVGMLGTAVGIGWYCYRLARRELGGITGDVAGYFVQLCELGLVGVILLLQKVEVLL